MTRKPVSFAISDKPDKKSASKPVKSKPKKARQPRSIPTAKVEMHDDDFIEALQQSPSLSVREPQTISTAIRWGTLLFSAFTGLLTLWVSMSVTNWIENLFARSEILGWLGTGLLAILALAALALALREIIGMFSLRKLSAIHENIENARTTSDQNLAAKAVSSLEKLYGSRSDMTWKLANLNQHNNDIMTPLERLQLAERILMEPLDEQAGQIIAATSRRVTLLTAVTPAAILDIAFVGFQNLKMLRALATLYGGRPGTFGTMKLAGMVVSHLAVTGGLALTDNLVQHVVGKGLLGRLSARFGEGAVNGILTTRIGLAALDLTRPVPFTQNARPSLAEMLKNVIVTASSQDNKKLKEP